MQFKLMLLLKIMILKLRDLIYPSTYKVQTPWLAFKVFHRDVFICPVFIFLYSLSHKHRSSHLGHYINMDHTMIHNLVIHLPILFFCMECSSLQLYSMCQNHKHTLNAATAVSTSSVPQGVLNTSLSLLFFMKTLFILFCHLDNILRAFIHP